MILLAAALALSACATVPTSHPATPAAKAVPPLPYATVHLPGVAHPLRWAMAPSPKTSMLAEIFMLGGYQWNLDLRSIEHAGPWVSAMTVRFLPHPLVDSKTNREVVSDGARWLFNCPNAHYTLMDYYELGPHGGIVRLMTTGKPIHEWWTIQSGEPLQMVYWRLCRGAGIHPGAQPHGKAAKSQAGGAGDAV